MAVQWTKERREAHGRRMRKVMRAHWKAKKAAKKRNGTNALALLRKQELPPSFEEVTVLPPVGGMKSIDELAALIVAVWKRLD